MSIISKLLNKSKSLNNLQNLHRIRGLEGGLGVISGGVGIGVVASRGFSLTSAGLKLAGLKLGLNRNNSVRWASTDKREKSMERQLILENQSAKEQFVNLIMKDGKKGN